MSFKKLVIGGAAVLSLAACSKSNNSSPAPAATLSGHALDNSGNSGLGTYTAGTPATSFTVASESVSYDGNALNNVDQSSFQDPGIASQVSTLAASDKVIQTQANTLELWSQGNLLMAFDLSSGTPTPLQTGSTYAITSASYTMSPADDKQGQGLANGVLALNMQDCAVVQPKQDQGKGVDQGQDQGKGVDQGQAPIDQGKGKFVTADTKGQDQGKAPMDQGKDQDKAPACHVVALSFNLTQIAAPAPKQEQGQDQGKAPIDQGKGSVDQGQDQGKAPIDQGKAPNQDQGKAPIDQGKAPNQDQGKAPIDQGKH